MRIDPGDWLLRGGLALAAGLARYNRHRVLHLDEIHRLFRAGRRVVLVGNHALDVADPLLLFAAIYRRTHRLPRFIAHENGWFSLPAIRDFSRHFNVVPSRRLDDAVAALRHDGFLAIYPGGVREAGMRSYRDEPYRLKWDGRIGFLRAALEADADVLFVAAVGNDEAYYQSRLATPDALLRLVNGGQAGRYRGLPLRFGILGPHVLPGIAPLPVQITHVLSKSLDLGDREEARRDPRALDALHRRVWDECQRHLDAAVRQRRRHADLLDRTVRSAQQALHYLGI
jgi:hypothetical protein